MSPWSSLSIIWWVLLLWLVVGSMSGVLMKKERLTVIFLMDVIAMFFCLHLIWLSHHIYSRGFWCLFLVLNTKNAIRTYKTWKNTDDDDDWKHRRKVWVKNHLPKPITKKIPVPI